MRNFRIIRRDVMEALPQIEAASFDACLCDPPYGLKFMGKQWDHGVPSAEAWAEVLRVLKPGACLLAFGGTRTFHRLACAIEDAGFELFDTACWLYGSGFPKSMDISKAIDKAAGAEREVIGRDPHYSPGRKRTFGDGTKYNTQARGDAETAWMTAPATPEARTWSGYGSALKPAWEPIIMARKPVERTYANNALKHGCGGLNIEGCRIDPPGGLRPERIKIGGKSNGIYGDGLNNSRAVEDSSRGRWPANLILDDEAARLLDEQSGELTSGFMAVGTLRNNRMGYNGAMPPNTAARDTYADSGGASRFFYTAKADSSERAIGGVTNTHPTVKPIDLCAWLAKLILPPERDTPRRLLVPFSGSGSEIIGALRADWDFVVGIERESNYAEIARQRISGDAPLLNMEATA